METLTFHPEASSERGFSMVEVLIAMFVLSTGLIALSSLAAQNLGGTARSRYISLASTYASEKLEDLNQWPTTDPDVCVSSGGTAGSLTTDTQVSSVTCNGTTTVGTMNYYDDVQVADTNGKVCETVSTVVSGAESYVTTCHTAGGQVTQTSSPTANAADVGTVAFHRRWTIEMDQPITSVRRVTVLVTLENGYVQPPVTFQMSAVRP
jgi:prepilin-type N-terminal cleavage/methylation domain-containing protein